jgi:hypothetical protein
MRGAEILNSSALQERLDENNLSVFLFVFRQKRPTTHVTCVLLESYKGT